MTGFNYQIRKALPHETARIGELMVEVYSKLPGFPTADQQPKYYRMLANIGELTNKPATELLVAVTVKQEIAGAVVYFSDMHYYGSGGTATAEKNASGFRLLAVDPLFRGQGIGKLLVNECIRKARKKKHRHVVIHSTEAMKVARRMYEQMGFRRAIDLDFMQGELAVFGYRLSLE